MGILTNNHEHIFHSVNLILIAQQNTASLPEGSDILTAVIVTLLLVSK